MIGLKKKGVILFAWKENEGMWCSNWLDRSDVGVFRMAALRKSGPKSEFFGRTRVMSAMETLFLEAYKKV